MNFKILIFTPKLQSIPEFTLAVIAVIFPKNRKFRLKTEILKIFGIKPSLISDAISSLAFEMEPENFDILLCVAGVLMRLERWSGWFCIIYSLYGIYV